MSSTSTVRKCSALSLGVAVALVGLRAHAQSPACHADFDCGAGEICDPSEGCKPLPATVVPFEISLFYPIHIFHPDRKIIKGLSLNIVHGATTSVYGLELGGAVNYAGEDATGLRLAGAVSYAGNDADGIQVAGLVNYAGHDGSGLRLAGLVSFSGSNANGVQLAGIMNYAGRDGTGLRLAGIENHADGAADGIQIAGLINHAGKRSFGIQLAGMFNWDNSSISELGLIASAMAGGGKPGTTERYSIRHVSEGEVGGLQVAGLGNSAMYLYGVQISALVNRAFRLAEGGQIGAFVNYAGDLSGFQLGPINVAQDVVGLQVGVLNVARKLRGLQIGVANVAYENPLPFMVIVNAGWGSFDRDPKGATPPRNSDVQVQWQ